MLSEGVSVILDSYFALGTCQSQYRRKSSWPSILLPVVYRSRLLSAPRWLTSESLSHDKYVCTKQSRPCHTILILLSPTSNPNVVHSLRRISDRTKHFPLPRPSRSFSNLTFHFRPRYSLARSSESLELLRSIYISLIELC